MMHGRHSGKKLQAFRIVKPTLEIIHLHLLYIFIGIIAGVNPIQVVIDAVSKTDPREDSTCKCTDGVVGARQEMWPPYVVYTKAITSSAA
jgi:ribosomal protein S7